MPGKRSAGVTFWAIVLILGGISTAVGAVVSVAVGPNIMRSADQRLAQLQTQLEAALEKQQQQPQEQLQDQDEEPSSAQAAQVQAQLKQTFGKVRETYRHLRELYETPSIQVAFLIGGLLGVAALIGGIGVLRLRGWGRTLVLWQAGLSIIYGVVWWMTWSSQQQNIVPDLSSMPTLPNTTSNPQLLGTCGAASNFALLSHPR